MDLPLHLRLAYAACFSDPYADARCLHGASAALHESASLAAPKESSWFSDLVQLIEQNRQQTLAPHAPENHDVSHVELSHSSVPNLPVSEEEVKVEVEGTLDIPRRLTSIEKSPSPLRNSSSTQSLELPVITAQEIASPHPNVSAAMSMPQPSGATSGVGSQASAPVQKVNVITQTGVAADTAPHAAQQQQKASCLASDPVANTGEAILADLTTSLERRLQDCVLKTLALDDANQQLICAFQLPPKNTATSSDQGGLRLGTKTAAAVQASQQTLINSGALSEAPPSPSAAAAAPLSIAAVAANRSDASLSEEARKELAMHLYALRHQVVAMRQQLDTHEAAHARELNRFKSSSSPSSGQRPPIRVEVVRAYEEDPTPYRKGPWRQADFAAAGATRRSSDNRKDPGKAEGGEDDYSSNDFTDDTSEISTEERSSDESTMQSAPKEQQRQLISAPRKDHATVSSVDSDSSVSSTEELFQRRQAAALQARKQRTAAAAARQQKRSSSSSSSSPSSSPSSSSDRSTTSSLTDTSTISTSDTHTS